MRKIDHIPVLKPKNTVKMPPRNASNGAKKVATKAKAQRSGDKKNRRRSRRESYGIYIYKVLKQAHPNMSVSKKAVSIMNSFVNDIFERLADEASSLANLRRSRKITPRDIQNAVKLQLPGELRKIAISQGVQAILRYDRSRGRYYY